jgi:hypothetical protein
VLGAGVAHAGGVELSQSTGSIKLRMTFRILVILQLVSLIVLSPLYGTYVDLYAQGDTEINIAGSTSGFLLRWAFVLVLLVLYLATYVGLLWFKRWARTLLPVAMALSLAEPFLYRQAYPYSGIEEVLSNLSDYLDGALLILAWATDLRFRFVRRV